MKGFDYFIFLKYTNKTVQQTWSLLRDAIAHQTKEKGPREPRHKTRGQQGKRKETIREKIRSQPGLKRRGNPTIPMDKIFTRS